jgi:hypothetical protein
MEDVPQEKGTMRNKRKKGSFGKTETVYWQTHIHWKCLKKKERILLLSLYLYYV